jgi:hypothetical protein
MNLLTICTIISLLTLTQTANVDNDIIDNPLIECGASDVRVTLNTNDVFYGEMYVSGKSDVSECRNSDEVRNNHPSITLKFGTCGVERMRTDLPQGLSVV